MQIGIIIIATNKYIDFVPTLIDSLNAYFLVNHDKEIFLFTNQPYNGNVTIIPTDHQEWPWMTLGRYHIIQQLENYPKKDYYFYIDADMKVLDYVGDEILGRRVATIHGRFKKKPGTYDRNPDSLAYISKEEIPVDTIAPYYCGGFQGGSDYLADAKILSGRISIDKKNGVTALWHDESHWNRFLLDHPATVVLPHYYCSLKHDDKAKIGVVKKDSNEVRS